MTFSILVLIIIMAALSIIVIVANWIIYEKASKPGWASIVPIYNTIVLLEIVGKPIWWIALMLIPVANIVFAIWVTNLLAKSFGKDEAFTVGLILMPIIFYPILGFGASKYQGPSASEAQTAA